jgi:hypothetical protein
MKDFVVRYVASERFDPLCKRALEFFISLDEKRNEIQLADFISQAEKFAEKGGLGISVGFGYILKMYALEQVCTIGFSATAFWGEDLKEVFKSDGVDC